MLSNGSCFFKNIYAAVCHGFCGVSVNLKSGTDIRVAKARMDILYVSTVLNEHGCMGMPQGMTVEGQLQFVVDHSAAIFKRIRAEFSRTQTIRPFLGGFIYGKFSFFKIDIIPSQRKGFGDSEVGIVAKRADGKNTGMGKRSGHACGWV